MNPGKFNNRIEVKYLTKSADGYGGFNSSSATDLTVWGDVQYKKGELKMENGARSKYKEVEVIIRKKAFDEISNTDFIFSIDNSSSNYRVNDVFEVVKDEYVKIIATDLI